MKYAVTMKTRQCRADVVPCNIYIAIAHAFGWPQAPAMAAGALLCFGLRYGAIRRGWRLPVAKSPE